MPRKMPKRGRCAAVGLFTAALLMAPVSGAFAQADAAKKPADKPVATTKPADTKATGPEEAPPRKAGPTIPVTGAFDIRVINDAMDKAVGSIYRREPEYTFPPEFVLNQRPPNPTVRNQVGYQALASWALLAAGESYQNPPLYRRINYVLSSDVNLTFDRGMRATMLGALPHHRWAPWINRDWVWFSSALNGMGNFGDGWTGSPPAGPGDNANGQYGVLGLWCLQDSGANVKSDVWDKIDKYWRSAQEKTDGNGAAGYAVSSFAPDKAGVAPAHAPGANKFYTRVSGPMTAGGVATLALTERYLRGSKMGDPKPDNMSVELRKSIRWLDENFDPEDRDEASDRYYYYWVIQRIGNCTGYRFLNGHDWYIDITSRILKEQLPDGTFQGDKGPLLSTGFALLYLSKCFDPMAVGKIRLRTENKDGKIGDFGAWNNRPHDIWNFADFASDEYEVSTSWQIMELTQPVAQLMETPILYLATDQSFSVNEREVNNLREYLQAGGLLVTNADDPNGVAIKSIKSLANRIFEREIEFDRIDKDHPFYTVHQKLPPGIGMQVVSNGIRPMMVHFTKDIGRGLQLNDMRQRDSFSALSNIYLYVTGMNPRRTRLESNYIPILEGAGAPAGGRGGLKVARIKYTGRYDPEPLALKQMDAFLSRTAGLNLDSEVVSTDKLSDHKMAFLTTTGSGDLSDKEAMEIRAWVEAGGTLFIDAAGGGPRAAEKAQAMFRKLVPNVISIPMDRDNPILSGQGLRSGFDNRRVQYRWFALRAMGPIATPRVQGVELGGRTAIIYSAEDITCGMAGLDHWGIFGYKPQFARQLVANACQMAALNPTPNLANPPTTFAQDAADRVKAAQAYTQPADGAPANDASGDKSDKGTKTDKPTDDTAKPEAKAEEKSDAK